LFLAFVVDYEGEITDSLELQNNICLFDFICVFCSPLHFLFFIFLGPGNVN